MFRKSLVAGALAAAAALSGLATPAHATGPCDEKVEVLCQKYPCAIDNPCWIQFCVLYYSGSCVK
jgi:hypothetical protein